MERNESAPAIVISSSRSGQNDRRLTLLSPVWGLIYVTSYGARKAVKNVKAPLYTEATFYIYRNREKNLNCLVDLMPISYHENTGSSLETAIASSLFAELAALEKGEEALQHYELLTKAYDAINEENWRACMVQYLVRYLELCGLSVGFDYCPICGSVYPPRAILGFSRELNVPTCPDCDTMAGSFILPPNARAYLSRSLKVPFETALEFIISEEMLNRIIRYLVRYTSLALGIELRAVKSGLLDGLCK